MTRQPECCAFCAHRIRVLRTRWWLHGRLVWAHKACAIAYGGTAAAKT